MQKKYVLRPHVKLLHRHVEVLRAHIEILTCTPENLSVDMVGIITSARKTYTCEHETFIACVEPLRVHVEMFTCAHWIISCVYVKNFIWARIEILRLNIMTGWLNISNQTRFFVDNNTLRRVPLNKYFKKYQ